MLRASDRNTLIFFAGGEGARIGGLGNQNTGGILLSHEQYKHSSYSSIRSNSAHQYDPMFPAMKQRFYNSAAHFFGYRFGLPSCYRKNTLFTRRISSKELLRIYSINVDMTSAFPPTPDAAIDDLLPYCIPWKFRKNIMCSSNYAPKIMESFCYSNTTQCDTEQFYSTCSTTQTLDWHQAYKKDTDTNFIMSKLFTSENLK